MMYRTRRDWLLAEIVIGSVSIATGLSAISGYGLLSIILQKEQTHLAWLAVFVGSGSALLFTAVAEMSHRRFGEPAEWALKFYAWLRHWWHFMNALCWLYACGTLFPGQQDYFLAAIFYESVPLLILNVWGATEHAKALYFDPLRAGDISLVRCVLERVRG